MDEQHRVGDTDSSQAGSGDQSFTDPSGIGESDKPETDTSQSEGTPDPAADVTQGDESGQRSASESTAPADPTSSHPPTAGSGAEPAVEGHPPEPEDPMVSAEAPEGLGPEDGYGPEAAPEGAVGEPGEPASGGAPGQGAAFPAGNAPPVAGQTPVPDPEPPPEGQTTAGAVDASHPSHAVTPEPSEEADAALDEPEQIETERPDIGTE